MLKTYNDFISRVNELGYFPFCGQFLSDFPILQAETLDEQWHTGDIETDPWKWKDRSAMEKKLAFGCILGGYKGFVSKELYPLFYAAYRPTMDIEEYYKSGQLSQITWELYKLFDNGAILSTSDIRNTFGVTKKTGASKVDTAIQELERNFYITVCGNKRKVSYEGKEYGWPANTYTKVENWIPSEWLIDIDSYDTTDARSQILDHGCSINKNIDRLALSKLLFKNKKGRYYEVRNFKEKPECFIEAWPGQFDIFHHYEFTSGVPSVLFMITTIKENGKPNACLHAWSTFSGDKGGFYAIMTALMQSTHTYKNILRDKEFCINFLDSSYYESCINTINQNTDEDDEFKIGGFTIEPAKTTKAPRIKEAFLTYECSLESITDISGLGINAMIIGKVQHISMDENYNNVNTIASDKGFMFNIHCPKDSRTSEGLQSAVASLKINKLV